MRTLIFPLLLLSTQTASAENPSSDPHQTIVVTASRTPITLGAAGSGTSVITREDIERRGPSFLTDLLRDEAGFSVSRGGGMGQQTQLRIRGGEADHVLVLIDGIEANDLTRGGGFDFAHLLAADIERVEIVRGPQSALWGSDAISGVVNIVTRAGGATPHASLAVEGGSFGTVNTSGHLSGARHGVDAAVNLSHLQSEGINLSPTGREADGYRNTTLNTKLGWDALSNLRFDLTGRVTGSRVNTDYGDGIPSDSPFKTNLLQVYTQAKARLDSFGGHWRNEITGNFSRMDNDDLDQLNFIDAEVTGNKYRAQYQSSLLGETTRFLPANHVLTFAFDYEKQQFSQRGPVLFGYDPNQQREYATYGYVGEYRLTLAEHSTLSASGRWDDSDAFADVGTWRVALTHLFPHTGTLLSWSYATGQKAPTFFDRFGYAAAPPGDPVFVGNQTLKPEQSKGWEFGIQQSVLGERAKLGLTYFNEILTDEINGFIYDPATNTFSARNLPGTSHRQGIEFTGRIQLRPQWDARATYTWLDSSQIDQTTRARVEEIRRAPHALAASTAWYSADRRGSIDLHLTHTSQQQDDAFMPDFSVARVDLAPYTLLGVSGRYQLTPLLGLQARLDNVLDDDYQEVYGRQTEGVAGYVGISLKLPD